MSVIVFDGKTIAADKQTTHADVKESTTKIKRLANGDIVGHTGELSKGLTLVKWYESGCDPEKYPKFQEGDDWVRLVVFKKDGTIVYYEGTTEPIKMEEEKTAWGCGRDLALGAMEMGADAVTAVKVACKYSVYCGMGIDSFPYKKALKFNELFKFYKPVCPVCYMPLKPAHIWCDDCLIKYLKNNPGFKIIEIYWFYPLTQ